MKKILVLLIGLGFLFTFHGSQIMTFVANADNNMTHCSLCDDGMQLSKNCLGIVSLENEIINLIASPDQVACSCEITADHQSQIIAVFVSKLLHTIGNIDLFSFADQGAANLISNNPFNDLLSGRSPPAQYLAYLNTVQQLK